ncbi:MAG: branched-chain amino acid ABC transporter permease [Chloroflexota bacterium]
MATQEQPRPLNPVQSLAVRQPVIAGVLFIAIATGILLIITRQQLLFPFWSSIAFPMLAVSPFIVFALKIPTRIKLLLVLVVILLIIPYLGLKDSFYLELAVQIGIFAAMAMGLNIVVGFAGLLDLGYIAFFAVGAYLWGIFASKEGDTYINQIHAVTTPESFYLFLFGGIALAAIAGILLGLPVLRLKGDYLAIVTLGFGEMIRVLVSNLSNISSDPTITINITNGAQGLSGIASPPLPQFVFDAVGGIANLLGIKIGNIEGITYQFFFYFLVLFIGLIAALIAARLDNSPIGRAWTAIREDEIAARAMGVPLVRMKLLAFATGASFAGAMGVIYAAKQTFVSPESFSFNQSIFILVIVIVGGMGSIRGVVLGAVAVTLLNLQILPNLSLLLNSFKNSNEVSASVQNFFKSIPSQLEPAKYQRFVFGILLVLMMIYRPAGILPASRRKLEIDEQMGKAKDEALPRSDVEPEGPFITEDPNNAA